MVSDDSAGTSKEPSVNEQNTVAARPKKSKKWKWILLILILAGGSWVAYQMYFRSYTNGPRINPLNLVPEGAVLILETDQPYNVWNELSATKLWKILQKDEEWKDYGEQLASVEASLADFDRVLDLLTNRKLYLSVHPYGRNEVDLLFVLDMDGLGILRTWLTRGTHITQRQFQGKTIYEQFDPSTKETLYFCFENNFLIGSFTHTLVEASISGQQEAALSRSLDFIAIRKKVVGEGLIRLYLNYEALFPYLASSMGTDDQDVLKSQLPFLFSGFYLDIEEKALSLEGYSNYVDSTNSYVYLMSDIGKSDLDIARVAPARTSVLLSFGFDSFSRFYEKLQERLKKDQELVGDYESYTRKTEKFLDISIEDDLVAWIANEVALIQIESDQFKSETAFVLKAKNASLAREKMAFLNQQIRRKTPVRFKEVDYRGYPVNFMSVKGLFNLVLGRLFKRFDRPYYTIINEYVIFSNQPNVLRLIIDSWVSENTLSEIPSFQAFVNELGEDHNALLYLRPPLLERTNTGLLDEGTIQLVKSKQSILSSFPQSAFKLQSSGKFFKTQTVLSIESLEKEMDLMEVPTPVINYDSIWQADPGEQIEVTEIEIVDLGAKKQTEPFDTGLPKYEVDIKDGQKHGSYFEYHESGELKIKGKYKNDLKEGIWKYYDLDGKMVKREKYKSGELIQ